MSSRFSRPDSRSDLFSAYNRSASPSKSKSKPHRSPYNGSISHAYGYNPGNTAASGSGSGNGGLYPGGSVSGRGAYGGGYGGAPGGGGVGGEVGGDGMGGGGGEGGVGYRSATPNSRGQYSAAVLEELESQNEKMVGVLSGKVKMLKDLTHLIGDEIRDSTTLAQSMNDQFENSRLKIRGTMNRMLSMARKTGIGWKVWLGFFGAVVLLFWWVWLG